MFRRVGFALRSVFRRRDLERQMDEEIRFHVAMEADKLAARGLDP